MCPQTIYKKIQKIQNILNIQNIQNIQQLQNVQKLQNKSYGICINTKIVFWNSSIVPLFSFFFEKMMFRKYLGIVGVFRIIN